MVVRIISLRFERVIHDGFDSKPKWRVSTTRSGTGRCAFLAGTSTSFFHRSETVLILTAVNMNKVICVDMDHANRKVFRDGTPSSIGTRTIGSQSSAVFTSVKCRGLSSLVMVTDRLHHQDQGGNEKHGDPGSPGELGD